MKAKPKVKDRLRDLGVAPSKIRGQNFLIDDSVLNEITDFLRLSQDDTVLEIGPGLGALTEQLPAVKKLILVEIEPSFAVALSSKFPTATVINQDIRQLNFAGFAVPLTVIGNLPYSISTDIIMQLTGYADTNKIKRAIFMLQHEFVQRLVAVPGNKDYGALTIAVQLFFSLREGPVISGDAFHPPTSVLSQLVELTPLPTPHLQAGSDEHKLARRLVQGCFMQRRKKMKNAFAATNLAGDNDPIDILNKANIDPHCRPEEIPVAGWMRLLKTVC